jgi:hypothetical protein
MVVFGAEVDEQKYTRVGDAVGQQIEQRLGLAVDPVQVLKDDDGGLIQAFAQDEALDRVENPPALDLRIHLRDWVRTLMQSQQSVEQRQRIVERRVEGADPRLNPGPSRGLVVGVFDAEVNDRAAPALADKPRPCRTRYRVGFKQLPVAGQRRLELVYQP